MRRPPCRPPQHSGGLNHLDTIRGPMAWHDPKSGPATSRGRTGRWAAGPAGHRLSFLWSSSRDPTSSASRWSSGRWCRSQSPPRTRRILWTPRRRSRREHRDRNRTRISVKIPVNEGCEAALCHSITASVRPDSHLPRDQRYSRSWSTAVCGRSAYHPRAVTSLRQARVCPPDSGPRDIGAVSMLPAVQALSLARPSP